jgi:hypothetical protein
MYERTYVYVYLCVRVYTLMLACVYTCVCVRTFIASNMQAPMLLVVSPTAKPSVKRKYLYVCVCMWGVREGERERCVKGSDERDRKSSGRKSVSPPPAYLCSSVMACSVVPSHPGIRAFNRPTVPRKLPHRDRLKESGTGSRGVGPTPVVGAVIFIFGFSTFFDFLFV